MSDPVIKLDNLYVIIKTWFESGSLTDDGKRILNNSIEQLAHTTDYVMRNHLKK